METIIHKTKIMEGLERMIGQFDEFKSHLGGLVKEMASDIKEIKVQSYKTNGRVNMHDSDLIDVMESVDKLQKKMNAMSDRRIKTDTYIIIMWGAVGLVAGFLLTHFLELLFKNY